MHTVPLDVLTQMCAVCMYPAGHRIQDASGPKGVPPLKQYLCCMCLAQLGMHCGLYPDH